MGTTYINYLNKKLACSAGMLNHIKDNIPTHLHKTLYHTLFESHLAYGISVWGGISHNKLLPLFKTQKMCVRIMFGDKAAYLDKFETCVRCRPFDNQILGEKFYVKEHTKPLFQKFELMTVHNLYRYHCTSQIFTILKTRTPISLYAVFTVSSRKETFLITGMPSSHFVYKSSILWNETRDHLQILDLRFSYSKFKSNLKKCILNTQNSGDKSCWQDFNFRLNRRLNI